MGHLEQFAQRTFAEETERITDGAAGWQDPPEIRLEKVTSDGFLLIRRPHSLAQLPEPWPQAQPHGEVMLELKMPGNHLDRLAVARGRLRREVRQVQRLEADPGWTGEEPLWLVAPHLPEWLRQAYEPACFAPGCYWIEPRWQRFLWIAANELPLQESLIPFLMARSGHALDEFGRWVAPRRPLEWVLAMIVYLPMSLPTREELLWRFRKVEDPEIEARRQHILEVLLEASPQTQQRLVEQGRQEGWQEGRQEGHLEGRLSEARASLRRVLARRQLVPSQADLARIDACAELPTLERWLDQAVTAVSVADALS